MPSEWTLERRAAQAERIRATQPWLKSTGPRTAEGKARSSGNAYKHGGCAAGANELRALLRLNHEFLRARPPPRPRWSKRTIGGMQ